MVKGDNKDSTLEPRRTRQQSASLERRNSVSEITDYFQTKANNTPMSRKASGKTKDKEREKELKETRENIKALIKGIDSPTPIKDNSENTNGGDQANAGAVNRDSNENVHDDESHDKSNAREKETKEINSIATQTSEDEMLSAIKELALKYKKMEDTIEDPKNGLSVQLAKTQNTVTQLYTDINGAVSGLKVQMERVTKIADENTKKIDSMESGQRKMMALLEENKRIVQELKVMQGLVQKVSQQTVTNSDQLLDLTRRGMEQNLIIHGADNSIEIEDGKRETPMFTFKERCFHSALKFFKEVMNLDLDIGDIWKAHRTGQYKADKMRPLIIKVSYQAKDLIMENISCLKDKCNPVTKQKYFVGEQIPEGISEVRKQISGRIKVLRDQNDKKPREEKDKIQVVNNCILINDKIQQPEITPPRPSELFLDTDTQSQVDQLQAELVETEPEILRNSEFIGLAAKADSVDKVRKFYTAVYQRYPSADHAIMAYALREGTQVKSGSCDDREFGAGNRLKKLIFETRSRDTVLFVLRKYGGVHLGFQRFAAIENVAKAALALL